MLLNIDKPFLPKDKWVLLTILNNKRQCMATEALFTYSIIQSWYSKGFTNDIRGIV